MSFPSSTNSSNSQDPSHTGNLPSSSARTSRVVQQSVWGGATSSQGPRRGLTPLSTNQSPSQQDRAGTASPSRNPFSPTATASHPAVGPRQVSSRHSSISSSSSLFSPLGPSGQAAPSSSRSRNVTSSGSPHLASSAAAFSSQDRGGGGGSSSAGGGGTSRFVRQSPSLSGSATGSPVSSSGPSAGGGSGQITSLVITQLNILLSTFKEDRDSPKWQTQADKIWKLVDANGMEVYSTFFRRLLQSNASQIFGASARSTDGAGAGGTYGLLVQEMQKLVTDFEQSQKIAESLDTTDGDLFRDFDLATFMNHFRLNAILQTSLAVACKSASKPELRTKADAIISNNFDAFVKDLSDPVDKLDELPPTLIASILDHLIRNPPRGWNEERRTSLQHAVRLRYNNLKKSTPYAVGAAILLDELLSGPYTLVRLLHQTGARGTQGVEAAKATLGQADQNALAYHQVASALLYMVIAQETEKYDPAAFVTALRQHRLGQRVDWRDVLNAFDRPDVRITKPQFLRLYHALLPIANADESFDIQGLWGNTWSHPETQLSFVVAFLQTTPTELDVSQIPRLRQAYKVEEFADASDEIKDIAAKAATHPMVSYDATQALFTIIFSSQDAYNHAQTLGIPEAVINANTDIFVCAASAISKPWAPLQEQALKQLFAPFFMKALANHSFVMHALWIHDKTWLAGRLIEHYNTSPRNLGLIFDHAQEHGWVDALVAVRNDFGLDFTAMAHSHGLVDIEQWAQGHVDSNTVPATELSRAIINFLRFKIEDELKVQKGLTPNMIPLNVKTVFALLNVIQGTVTEQEEGAIQRHCIQAYPRLINYGYNFDHVIDANGENGNALSESADAKMQEEYKVMYGGDANAGKMINTLRQLKDSEQPEDQELFACMIHGLFDEYNCFGEYPLEALATTAVLFGGIINYGILHSRITLSVALYMVVDAVTEFGPEDSMYKFGLQALLHFMGRLEEWPQLCERLCRIPHLRNTEVQAKAEEVVHRQAAGQTNGAADDQPTFTNGEIDDFVEPAYQPFASVNVDPPYRSNLYEDPDEETSDKVMFVLNNVSKRNLEEKFKDLETTLREQHSQWFAHYLVEDLAKAQPNFQTLYLQILNLFDLSYLWSEVIRETYVSISRIINAESTLTSATDRGNLKNLAGWLGLLTLARDRPILHRNISFRDLLIEAYQTERLLIAIPFTCKVLAQAANSEFFKAPNPWTMECLGILIELYHFAELKLNLKFEIEVLCKELDLDHKQLEPLDIIRTIPATPEDVFPQQYPSDTDGFDNMLSLSKRTNERLSVQDILKSLPDLAPLLHYPPAPGNTSQAQLKNVFLTAAQRAIEEIIAPVVDRSVTIAAISTAQLVEKDFAMEADEERMRAAAHNVVKSLSGSLALVTCKEPLRMSMSNQIRVLAAQSLPDPLPEGSILMFVNDNLDTVCKLVEDSAGNYSMAEIDAQLEPGIESRRRHRQQRPNEPFNEPPVSRYAFYVPEPYRQEHGGLNQQQLAIYDEFGRHLRMPTSTHGANASQDARGQLPDVLSGDFLPNLPTPAGEPAVPRQPVPQQQQQQRLPGPPSMPSQQPQGQVNGFVDPNDVMRRIDELVNELQHVTREAPEEHITELPGHSRTREVFEELTQTIGENMDKDRMALFAGTRATNVLFTDAKSRLEIEVLVQLLNQLCYLSNSTARQLVMYLSNLDVDKSFNAAITATLLKTMLLNLHNVDRQIAKALQIKRVVVLDYFSDLVEELLLSEQPGALRADFTLSYRALSDWHAEDAGNGSVNELLTKLQQPTRVPDGVPPPSPEEEKRILMEYVFDEWIMLQRQDIDNRSLVAFVHQLHDRRLISDHKDFIDFIRLCIDSSVEAYEREETMPFGNLDRAYVHVDALAKLVSKLVTQHDHTNGKVKGGIAKYLEQVLCLLIICLNHHYDTRQERFNARVFFRLFSTLLIELNADRSAFGEAYQEIYATIGRAFLALQPQIFPGFAFDWISLISHRMFVVPIMRSTYGQSWEVYTSLLSALLSFKGDLQSASEGSRIVQDFSQASLRVLCIVQHDYPEFLSANHLFLTSAVPTGMSQLNNLLSCANPAPFADLPDPFAPGFKINRLEQVRQSPSIIADIHQILSQAGLKTHVDTALEQSTKTEDIAAILSAIDSAPKPKKSLLINTLIVYITSAATVASSVFSASSPAAQVLSALLASANPETRYALVSAVANQLRYPNSHTHWLSTATIHYLSSSELPEEVQEVIVRVLVERIVVARPHPWGLLLTIVELVKNDSVALFEKSFIKQNPEVERILVGVANTGEGVRA